MSLLQEVDKLQMPNANMYNNFIFQFLLQQNSIITMIFHIMLSGKASS